MIERKGQMAEGATSNIITLIVGVGVAVLVLIFVGALGGQTYNIIEDDINAIANHPIVHETFVASNTTPANLAHNFVQTGSLTIVNNTATREAIATTNFDIDYDAGELLLKTDAAIGNASTSMQANYTWGAVEVRNSVQGGIISSFDALEQTGDYLPIIVLAVVIALVLSLILGFTAFRAGSGGTAL